MDYIILDIEFNGRKFASDLPMEVIEIGAVRLNASLEQTDEFSSLIKPVYFSKLNSFIKKKTGIEQEAIDQANGFQKVIADFSHWLREREPFILVTWGGEDLKRIVFDTRMHKLDDSYWMAVDYFDLLKGFVRYKNIKNDMSVEAALLDLGITPTGSAHRALDDAIMTAEVFRAIFASLDFEQKQQFKDVYSNAKERRIVKNAVRAMCSQQVVPQWELVVEHYLTNKVPLTDPRKLSELHNYFIAETAVQPKVGPVVK
ncbi:3'-5' exonuclease [Paenibacillus sp. N3.4]|uniref:3'-5' exonuclease n=1 Tax=Paenibacillus sp. N3.4 TaxID=2603222 RepID=UPI0011C9BB84|nr:3'-5' exonuclease [Paenibacillus sp. N3.4]TXK84165.1 exonuclease domain-containing protein [Paenibacillus sp. N3.4]